jgi:AcrR family transcriptional regulator
MILQNHHPVTNIAEMSRSSATGRPRNRAATSEAIVSAARSLLAREGFQGFGINAVAREAGCDKQLVYRYFDGLDGLVEALGASLADWVEQRLRPLTALGKPASYAELMQRLALGLLHALREDPLMQRILAWELAAPSPLLQVLTAARSRGLQRWMAQTRGSLRPPDGVDFAAVNAVLIAAVQQLVLASAGAGEFAGVALRSDADWERIRNTLKRMIAALLSDPGSAGVPA